MNQKEMEKNLDKVKELASQEAVKIKKELAQAVKKAQNFVKNNPEKTALISAGIGATVGAFLMGLMKGGQKAKKKAKKK